jgi:hypothetical protein
MQFPRLRAFVFVTAITVLFSGTASANSFDIDCGGQDDVDTDPAMIVGCNVATVGLIDDLNVDLHFESFSGGEYATDLQITLIHLSTGTSAVIYTGPEVLGPNSIMNASFDDSAQTLPSMLIGDIIGVFLPKESLSAFFGHELSGVWNLSILDTAYPGEGIDLIEWRLRGNQVPELGSGLLLAIGLFGLSRLSNERKVVRIR